MRDMLPSAARPADAALQGKWTPAPDWSTASLSRGDWGARPVSGLGQVLASGDLGAARARLAPNATEVGLGARAEALPVLVRIAPDRALFVTEKPGKAEAGWRDGVAFSPADSLYAVFALAGTGAEEALREGTAAPLDGTSRSAATLFAGHPVLLYRLGDEIRIHIESGLATALWHWLETRPD